MEVTMSRTVIINGQTVTPDGLQRADVRVCGDRIDAVEHSISPAPGEEMIDATGLLVLPGIIDAHTHFDLDTGKMRTRDDFLSGSQAAAAGGVTTYVNFAPQQRRQSLIAAVEAERGKAAGNSVVDFALHLSFGTPPIRWDRELAEVVEMGVTSAKVYTTYTDTIYYTRDWDWYQLMQRSGELGFVVQVHAENDDIIRGRTAELLAAGLTSFRYHGTARPEIAEVEAVSRGLAFARDTGSPIYFVHLSSPDSVALVSRARDDGVPAYAEVCVHHISLDDSVYRTDQAPRYVCTPPLRRPDTRARLLEDVLASRVIAIGSDHCGYSLDQRGSNSDFTMASPGIPGVETLWPVTYTTLVAHNAAPLEYAVDLVSRRPAEVFGLAPRKGSIMPGADADIVLYDPDFSGRLDERTLHSRAGYSPWHGFPVQGRVVRTISRGLTVYHDGRVTDAPSHGRFVKCRPFDGHRVEEALAKLAPVS
jgi:dihydropyrimidinase